jgi:hypothetical protein
LPFEKAGSWTFSLFFQQKAKRLERKSKGQGYRQKIRKFVSMENI